MNTPKKNPTTRKRKKKNSAFDRWKWHLLGYTTIILIFVGIHYRVGIKLFVQSVYERIFSSEREQVDKLTVHDIRNAEVFSKHQDMLFGFDVSHYQSEIDWIKIDSIYDKYPLDFVFIRATMGADGYDSKFEHNWKKAKSNLFVRGAYHYYRPDENSVMQARNFINAVTLEAGDFYPVLDIEDLPKKQSMDSLKSGIKKWLNIVEKHYKVKPIIYSGDHYFHKHLKNEFSEYPIWIANYNLFVEKIKEDWVLWQFTDKGTLKGVPTKVDLNIFQGNHQDLKKYLVKE